MVDLTAVSARALRILVVEDNPGFRDLVVDALRLTGKHAVDSAGTAEDGIRRLRHEAYDLLMTDVGLPGASGLEMLDEATAEGLLARTSVVVCSANRAQRPAAQRRGVRFFSKPIKLEEVFDIVDRAARDRAERSPRPRATTFEHRVSGYDFVRALLLWGYRLVETTTGHTLLARGQTWLRVPQLTELPEQVIRALLQETGLTLPSFVALLNRLESRDTWPEHVPEAGVVGNRSR